MQLITTNAASVSDEDAATFQEAYEALAQLPNTRALATDFDTEDEAKQFVKAGKAWATANGATFARKGDAKEQPTRVTFRVYLSKAQKEAKATAEAAEEL
jgi:hypothetical protein